MQKNEQKSTVCKAQSDDEGDHVVEWMADHEEQAALIVENWLFSHPQAAKNLYLKYSHFLGMEPVAPMSHNQYKRKPNEELRKLEKQQLFVEILKDVVSPDMDVNHLSHKILLNMLLLANADRSSLFLVEGVDDDQILVSRLFDVMENTSVEDAIHEDTEAIKMPVGVGIAGTVAKTGQPINVKNAYEDPRFNRDVDVSTGYVTKSILCMPIKTAEGQVIGVAQVINKNQGAGEFTLEDEEDFQMYLNFCAIGIVNSQLLDQSLTLSRKLQIILHLAKGLFEDTTRLEVMIDKVMQKSMELIPCQQSSVLLLDKDSSKGTSFSNTFQIDHQAMISESIISIRSVETAAITDLDIAKHVARTASPIIMSSVGQDLNVGSSSMMLNPNTKSILSIPIFNNEGRVLGIVQLTNKLGQPCFNRADMESLEVFAAFCGLGLHNVMMYEEMLQTSARNKVAIEVLSYHASSTIEDATRFMKLEIPESSAYHLTSFDFSDASLSEEHTVLASVRIFIDSGMVEAFNLNAQTLFRWVLTVKKNYRPITYHNWRHAFNVAQMMFAMFKSGNVASKLTRLEQFALLIACFCHDLDHRGTNNAFQTKSKNVLAELYSTSIMEHHHYDHCIMILHSEGNEILNDLSRTSYAKVMYILEQAILSTDLGAYFKTRSQFFDKVKNKTFSWTNNYDRSLLRGMMMTACDVGAITKPWRVQKVVANLVANEFFEQGDRERKDLQVEPAAMMDRRKKDELPKMQVEFVNGVCLPLYECLYELLPNLKPLVDGTLSNREKWSALAADPKAVLQETERDTPPEPILPQIPREGTPSPSLVQDTTDVGPIAAATPTSTPIAVGPITVATPTTTPTAIAVATPTSTTPTTTQTAVGPIAAATPTITTAVADKTISSDSPQDQFATGPIIGWRSSTCSDSSSLADEHKGKSKKYKKSSQLAEVSANKKHMKKCAMS